MEPIRREAAFQRTRWSMVRQATDPDERTIAMRALGAFCSDYWYPIYAFLRRNGYLQEDAEDISQAFFEKLSAGDTLAKADPQRGKLRNFLLFELKSLLKSRREKAQAKKRGGDLQKLSLDFTDAEGRYLEEPADGALGPDQLYARAWGLQTLDRCIERLAASWASSGKAEEFDVLRPFLSLNETGSSETDRAAEALDTSEQNIRKKVSRLRTAFAAELRKQIAESLDDPTDGKIDEELESLRQAVSG